MAEPWEALTEPLRALRKATRPLDALQEVQEAHGALGGLVCARCGKLTSNQHQGHFWSTCSRTMHEEGFHFCCPGDDPGCELRPREETPTERNTSREE